MVEQRSEEWFRSRLGKVTASRVADVMAKTKSGPSASRKNYMMELLCQRFTGRAEEGYVNAAMQRGTDLEPVARSWYEVTTSFMVDECGLIDHKTIVGFAASPDGLVGDTGLVEIKCPNTAQHVAALDTGAIDTRYEWQMLAQMSCTGALWCDYVSFDDRMPGPLQGVCIRFERDETRIQEMESEVSAFLKELTELEVRMWEKMSKQQAKGAA